MTSGQKHEATVTPRGTSDVLFDAVCPSCGWANRLADGMFRRQAEIAVASHLRSVESCTCERALSASSPWHEVSCPLHPYNRKA